MDVAVVLTLVQTLLQLLNSPIRREIESAWGYRSQLEKLRTTMSTVRAVLLDAEQQQRQQLQLTNTQQNKLERLKEAVYQADDLFDEIATLAQHKNLMSGNRVSKEVRLFFSRFNQLRSAFTLPREIKNVREIMDDIAKDHRDFGSTQSVGLPIKNAKRETYSYICEEDVIIGRDEDKRIVIDMLLDDIVEKDVCVISIVGIGGLGKTTLAQLVYNDDTIKKKFPLKMWVCVSDDFNVKLLLDEILAVATNQGVRRDLNMDQLQTKLREALDGKKYLLVLDDIWNEDDNEWRKLGNLLIRGGKDSRILVTTRSTKVAEIVGSHKIHELKGLSEEDSWNLFERMTLEPGQHQMEEHLVDIGKEIVRKCANVPLAIRVIGSLLRGHGEKRWLCMKDTDLANIKQDDQTTGILPVLKISYYYLPTHLKSCFSYCAVFPKDYKIIKEDLICLWMAQGFIVPLDDRQSFEDEGEEYFMNLLQRCFFQYVDRDEYGDIKSCKMHDLIHDVAREVAGTDIYNAGCFGEKTRHVCFDLSHNTKTHGHHLTKMKSLRTFLNFHIDEACSMKGLLTLRHLRVLDIRSTRLERLPSVIGQLLHLRYIDLSDNGKLVLLPTSITQLHNLQTLRLRGCSQLKELPRELSNLINLRHLDIHGCKSLTHIPHGLDCMTKLHKLTRFVLGKTSNCCCWGSFGAGVAGIRDLKELNNLRGSMEFKVQRGCIYDAAEVREGGYLINKPHLLEINIYWYAEPRESYIDVISEAGNCLEALLQGLQPHSNLRSLELWYYPGDRFPSWGGSSRNLESCLPNLVKIELRECRRLEHLPSMSQLRHLKVLILSNLFEVEYVESSNIRGEEGCTTSTRSRQVFFPSLEQLKLIDLPKLKGWWKLSSHSDLESREGETKTENGDDIVNDNNEQQQEKQLSTAEMHNSYSFPQLSYLEIWTCEELDLFDNEDEDEDEDEDANSGSRICRGGGGDNELPWRCLAPSLRDLTLGYLPKLVKLPKGMHHLTALHSLDINDCENLEAIPPWIDCLSSLQSLTIWFSSRLKSLPKEMRLLTSLQQLNLYGSSEELYERCQEPTGADWPKIQHIPHLSIRR